LATISSTIAESAAAKFRAHTHPDPSTRRGTSNFILSIMDERVRVGDGGLGGGLLEVALFFPAALGLDFAEVV
jgi:hypothetical protein